MLQILTNEAKQRVVQYRDEFLAKYPNNERDEKGVPKYTDAQWLDEVVKRNLLRILRRGDRILKTVAPKQFDLETE